MQLFHIDAARVGLFFLSLSGSTLVAPLLGRLNFSVYCLTYGCYIVML